MNEFCYSSYQLFLHGALAVRQVSLGKGMLLSDVEELELKLQLNGALL